jgi:hypothetical protein
MHVFAKPTRALWAVLAVVAFLAGILATPQATATSSLTAAPPAVTAVGDGSPSDPNIKYVGRWNTASAPYPSHWTGAYLLPRAVRRPDPGGGPGP